MALRTKDAIADMAQRLAQEQKLNEVVGRRGKDNMVRHAEDFRDHLSALVRDQVNDALKRLNPVRKNQLEALERRVAESEAKAAQGGRKE